MFKKEEANEEIKNFVTQLEGETEDLSETETREKYIDKFLKILNYPIGTKLDTNFVRLENQHRDYIIRRQKDEIPDIVIEAKRFLLTFSLRPENEMKGENDIIINTSNNLTLGAFKQAFSYAEEHGIEWIIVTNGKQLVLFNKNIRGLEKWRRHLICIREPKDYIKKFDDLWKYLEFNNYTNNSLNELIRTHPITTEGITEIVTILKKFQNNLFNHLKDEWIHNKNWNGKTCKDVIKQILKNDNPEEQDVNDYFQRCSFRLLSKILFISILEDFRVIRNNLSAYGLKLYSDMGFDKPVLRLINDVIEDFNEKYNGSLFKPNTMEDKVIFSNEVLKEIVCGLDEISYLQIDSDIFGDIYEHYLGELVKDRYRDENIRKKLGQYYTPKYVVDYIVKNTVTSLLQNYSDDIRNIKICDPGMGSGSFLLKVYEELYKEYKKRNEEIIRFNKTAKINERKVEFDPVNDPLKYNIYGIDINEEAVELAKMNLNLRKMTLESLPKPMFELEHIKCGDSLISDKTVAKELAFDWEEKFPEVFKNNQENGFDIILGNPPYINIENLDKAVREYLTNKNNYETTIKRTDIYIPFIEKALKILKEKGTLGYIVPYPFLSQDYGELLRKKLLDTSFIKIICDLKIYKIFPEVVIKNIILIFQKFKTENISVLDENKIEIVTPEQHPKITNKISGVIETSKQRTYRETYQNMFRLELNDKTQPIIQKMNLIGKKLQKILVASWGARGTPISKYEFDHKMNDKCKKLVKGKNISRYLLEYTDKWLLYEDLYRPAFIEIFENDKILISKVTGDEGIIACYDDNKYYTDDSLICCISKHKLEDKDSSFFGRHKISLASDDFELSKKYDLLYLLGVINSQASNFYHTIMLGYELNVYPESIEEIPFPIPSQKQHDEIINNVKKISQLYYLENLILKTFNNLLKNYNFNTSIKLSEIFPEFAHHYSINVAETHKHDEPENLSYIKIFLDDKSLLLNETDCVIISDIHFDDKTLQQFFYLSIANSLKENKHKKYNDLLSKIEIPIPSFNHEINAKQIKELMNELERWFNIKIQEEFQGLSIQKFDLQKIKDEQNRTEMILNNKTNELYGFDENEKSIIDSYTYFK